MGWVVPELAHSQYRRQRASSSWSGAGLGLDVRDLELVLRLWFPGRGVAEDESEGLQ